VQSVRVPAERAYVQEQEEAARQAQYLAVADIAPA
jgi:hypothetical protein